MLMTYEEVGGGGGELTQKWQVYCGGGGGEGGMAAKL
jgi:hypothetical protein